MNYSLMLSVRPFCLDLNVKDFFCTFHKKCRVLITFPFYTFTVYTCEYDCFWAVFFTRDETSYIITFSSTIAALLLLFFWCEPFLKSLICYILILFYVLAFWPWGMWDLISLTRDQRLGLNHWTAWGILVLYFYHHFFLWTFWCARKF